MQGLEGFEGFCGDADVDGTADALGVGEVVQFERAFAIGEGLEIGWGLDVDPDNAVILEGYSVSRSYGGRSIGCRGGSAIVGVRASVDGWDGEM